MHCTVKLKALTPNCSNGSFPRINGRSLLRRPYVLRLRPPVRARPCALLAVKSEYPSSSEPLVLSYYTSSVGTSSLPLSQWNLTQRHIVMLNVIACAAAVSATWLFFSAIPTLLAFKRAAESLEKLMDITREELPETMAAIRLSGMEISDLTMELSDIGQEISQGFRSSTRVVRLAEERLHSLTGMAPSALVQVVAGQKNDAGGPVVARTARGMREGIVKGRMMWQMFFTLTKFSRMALNYFANRAKK